MRRGTSAKLSQNRSTITAMMRLSGVAPVVFLPADGWLRAPIVTAFRQPSDRHFEGGV